VWASLIVYGTERRSNCKHRAPMAGRTGLEPVCFVTEAQWNRSVTDRAGAENPFHARPTRQQDAHSQNLRRNKLTPAPSRPPNWPDCVAPLERRAVERLSGHAGFRVV